MQDYADSRVVIVEKRAHDDSVLVSWDRDRWARDYKVVIHPDDDRSAKFADAVSGADSYRFINLQPDRVRGLGGRARRRLDASIGVRAHATSGRAPVRSKIALVGVAGRQRRGYNLERPQRRSDRYRVERSVDGGPFAEIENQPGAGDQAADSVDPSWAGKQISYRIFEWVCKQKLYSDAASFTVR